MECANDQISKPKIGQHLPQSLYKEHQNVLNKEPILTEAQLVEIGGTPVWRSAERTSSESARGEDAGVYQPQIYREVVRVLLDPKHRDQTPNTVTRPHTPLREMWVLSYEPCCAPRCPGAPQDPHGMCSGSEAGSYVRLIDFFITQL